MITLLGSSAIAQPFVDPRSEKINAIDADHVFAEQSRDPACYGQRLVSTGEVPPRDPHTLTVRWAGTSNFELAYEGKIILLDAYFDRGSNFPPLGFAAADVKKADVILVGHAHFDHMSDAASIAFRTGAIIVGAPVTAENLKAKLPGVDLALVAVSADFLNPLTEELALEHKRLYRPDVYMPAHHAGFSGHAPLWRATEPIFQALKDVNPKLVTVSREYREPVCFVTEVNIARERRR